MRTLKARSSVGGRNGLELHPWILQVPARVSKPRSRIPPAPPQDFPASSLGFPKCPQQPRPGPQGPASRSPDRSPKSPSQFCLQNTPPGFLGPTHSLLTPPLGPTALCSKIFSLLGNSPTSTYLLAPSPSPCPKDPPPSTLEDGSLAPCSPSQLEFPHSTRDPQLIPYFQGF